MLSLTELYTGSEQKQFYEKLPELTELRTLSLWGGNFGTDLTIVSILVILLNLFVYDEFVKRLQQERLSPERCTVQLFPLLVAEGLFADLNTELRPFRREIVLVIIEVSKETVNSLPQFLASDLSPVSDAFGILKDYGPVLTLNLSQGWQEQRQGRPFPPFPSLRRSFCGNSME